MGKHRILAFDGGPSVIVYTRLLYAIEQACPGFLHRSSLFAGTSSGSIVALYLARHIGERPESEGLAIARGAIDLADEIFIYTQPNLLEYARLALGVDSAFDTQDLVGLLERDAYLGRTTLQQLERKVTAVSFSMRSVERRGTRGPCAQFYSNFAHEEQLDSPYLPCDCHEDLRLSEVVMRSSAFPMMLPIREGNIDGGIFANNPSMAGLSELLRHRGSFDSPPEQVTDVVVFSLGGEVRQFGGSWVQRQLRRANASWGWMPWNANPFYPLMLLELVINATNVGATAYCEALLGRGYWRLADIGGSRLLGALLENLTQRSQTAIRRAERIAKDWVRGDADLWGGSYDQTREWIDECWMDETLQQAG